MTSRHYVFTINNPENAEFLSAFEQHHGSYAVFQLERGANGTLHVQGYSEFDSPVRTAQACAALGGRAWVERRRGTQDEAIAYATKPDSRVLGPWSVGVPAVGQGARSDIYGLAEEVIRGASDRDLVESGSGHHLIRYSRGIQHLRDAAADLQWRDVRGFYLWGPTGTGKTSLIYDIFGIECVYALASQAPLWFCGYGGQRVLLIDEYSHAIARETLLRVLDGHPYQAPFKGGHRAAQWTTVFLVSNDDFSGAFDPAMRRRFDGGGVFYLDKKRGEYEDLIEYVKNGGVAPAYPPPVQRMRGMVL